MQASHRARRKEMQAMMPMQTKKAPAAGQILPNRKKAVSNSE